MLVFKKSFFVLGLNSLLAVAALPALAQSAGLGQQLVSSSHADTWVATDGIGRPVATQTQGGRIRPDKFVGIFYFVWHGTHGYDRHAGNGRPDEGVLEKTPADTASPYDISRMLAANPQNPPYGPVNAFHHWGEPYFGYYLSNDEWVIRKHAQMLSDAGVDVIVLDVTNAFIYLPSVTRLAETYRAMRREGLSTPSIAFLVNSAPERTVQRLYENIYQKGLFRDLWFYWKGKPLLLCPPQAVTPEISAFFTTRQSWAWSKGQQWFGDGKDKWPWLDHSPQSYGWHESPDKPEQVSVSIAQHPISNIGRSYQQGKEPEVKRSGEGLYFAEQWERAHQLDPEFVFVTGWNEWTAIRFTDGVARDMMGRKIKKGETYFVDLYNAEYSRDAEPVKGDFHDNYYYQLVDNIRRFKGARTIPVTTTSATRKMDGKFRDWQKTRPVFQDDPGDTFHRRHPGWGRIREYVNTSGRNDIVESRVVSDNRYVYFYARTAAPLTAWSSADWMHLYISVKDSRQPAWEGFQYLVNRQVKSSSVTSLERSAGGWNWQPVADISYRTAGNELELRIPKEALGISQKAFTLDFKWVDNAPADGNALHWLDKGDAAPNARFSYRYIKE